MRSRPFSIPPFLLSITIHFPQIIYNYLLDNSFKISTDFFLDILILKFHFSKEKDQDTIIPPFDNYHTTS